MGKREGKPLSIGYYSEYDTIAFYSIAKLLS